MISKEFKDEHKLIPPALAGWRTWPSNPRKRPEVVEQLGGETNHSFRITDGSQHWVLRLNSHQSDAGIDRQCELEVHSRAALDGLAPAIEFVSARVLVTRFIEGRKATLIDLPAIAELFAKIHALKIEVRSIDLRMHLMEYWHSAPPDREIDSCIKQFLKRPLQETPIRVICHQDLTLENLIMSGTGLYAIDWEFARLSDPAYDLAVFAGSHDIGQEMTDALIHNYNRATGTPITDLNKSVEYYVHIYRVIEILWWWIRGKRLDEKIAALRSIL